ncbi:hypothetical protein [Halalkalicoccus salilacus]|uniref:hypothetical protein n=1 Tax=Halalkalicoccus TaxID=332246 RepID=UPI002F960ADB
MIDRTFRTLLFALYQSSVALGIMLLPIAVMMKRVGVTLPVHRLVELAERAYESRDAAE